MSTEIQLDQERKWIEQSKRDIACFRPLYEKYHPLIHRFLLRRTDDSDLADDLCSVTFLKAMEAIKKFRWEGKPLGAWLYRIAQNELRKHFRDKKPIFVIELERIECWDHVDEDQLVDSVGDLIVRLRDLPDEELHLLELRFFETMSFRDISAMLDMGESAVKMRIYRLLEKLKLELIKNDDEPRFQSQA